MSTAESETADVAGPPLPSSTPKLETGPSRPPRLLLQWHVTEQCNLRCGHCYQTADAGAPELPYDGMLMILEQFVRLLQEWGIPGHITFTGGEPFLKDWFIPLLEQTAKHRDRCSMAILTNGTLLDDGIGARLNKLGTKFVQVSVDGMRETHDAMRGSGAFDRALRGLAILRKHGIPSMVSFTAHAGNVKDFPALAQLCRRRKVGVVWSDRLLPLGRGDGMTGALMTPAEVEAFFECMYEARMRIRKSWFNRTQVKMHRALQFLTLRKHGERDAAPYRCSAGRTLLAVMPSGAVYPCRRMPVEVGRLPQQNLGAIYEASPFLQALREPDRAPAGCEACEFKQSCNGGLRCLSYAYYGDPFKADPQCFRLSAGLPGLP